jgi:hypothetical protein
MCDIWKNDKWLYNSVIIDEILPILYIGIFKYSNNLKNENNEILETNGDIISKILNKIYFNENYESPKICKSILKCPHKPQNPKRLNCVKKTIKKINFTNL